jgi:hypothetical protein
MLDSETVVRSPHSDTDDRLSVSIEEEGGTLVLYFPLDTGWSGESELLEVQLLPRKKEPFEPWKLMPRLPLLLQYARATLAHEGDDVDATLRALRVVGVTRRGLGADFYLLIAKRYEALVAEGEKYPVKQLAKEQYVDISTSSRWIKEARRRGYLPAEPEKVSA